VRPGAGVRCAGAAKVSPALAAVLVALVAVLVASSAPWPPTAAAAATPKRLPLDATIAGVPVAGLGPIGARRELRRVLGASHERPIKILADGRSHTVSAARAGLELDYEGMVERAFEVAAAGDRVAVRLRRSISRKQLAEAVSALARRHFRAPRDARVRFGITRVRRVRHRLGRGVDERALRRGLHAELRAPTPARTIVATIRRIAPDVTTRELPRVYGTYISIDRHSFKLRLFKRLRIVKTYGVALGAAGYDTPRGLHRIISRQVDPAWIAPKRPWAGALAGMTIPAGDPRNPLKARFLALGDGVGIHGTAEEWSIGSAASHGCIRMRIRDVKLLYPKVPVGTPVLIN